MNEYIPMSEQKRRVQIKIASFVGIGATYAAFLGGVLLLDPAWRWLFVGVGTLGPLAAAMFLPIEDERGRSLRREFLPILSIASAVILIACTLIFGPSLFRYIGLVILGAAAALGAIAWFVIWLRDRPSRMRRRLVTITVTLIISLMIAAIILGPALLRWISIGILAAFLFPILSEILGARRTIPSDSTRDVYYGGVPEHGYPETPHFSGRREAGVAEDETGLSSLNRTLARAQRMIDELLHGGIRGHDPRDLDDGRKCLVLSIAALDNLGVLPRDFSKKLLAKIPHQWEMEEPVRDRDFRAKLARLSNDIIYVRNRLQAHIMGARSDWFLLPGPEK